MAEDDGPPTSERLAVDVRDPDLCPRFVGRWVSGVTIGPSPGPRPDAPPRRRPAARHQRRRRLELRDARARQADPHVRRRGRPRGPDGRATIVVRRAEPGERLETLDHVERELAARHAAHRGRGRARSASPGSWAARRPRSPTRRRTSSSSRPIFDPVSIRRTAPAATRCARRRASRFEKGQESRLARIGADRTAQLLAAWAGGSVAPGRVDTAPGRAGARAGRVPAGAREPAPRHRPPDRRSSGRSSPGWASRPDARQARRDRDGRRCAPRPSWWTPGSRRGDLVAIVPTWRRDIVDRGRRRRGGRPRPRLRAGAVRDARTPPMPAFRPSPLEVRELVREHAGRRRPHRGRHARARVAAPRRGVRLAPRRCRRSATSRSRAASPSRSRTRSPATTRVLRRNLVGSLLDVVGSQPAPRAATTSRSSRSARATAASATSRASGGGSAFALTGAAEPPAWNRAARAVRPRRRQGHPRAPRGPARPRASAVFDRCRRGHVPPGPHRARDDRRPPRGHRRRAAPGGRRRLGAPHRRRGHRGARSRSRGSRTAAWRPERAPAVGRLPGGRARPRRRRRRSRRPPPPSRRRSGRAAGRCSATCRLFDIYRGVPLATDEQSLAYRLRFGAADRTLTDAEIEAGVAAIVDGLPALGGRLRT